MQILRVISQPEAPRVTLKGVSSTKNTMRQPLAGSENRRTMTLNLFSRTFLGASLALPLTLAAQDHASLTTNLYLVNAKSGSSSSTDARPDSLPQAPSAIPPSDSSRTVGGTVIPRATDGALALSLDDAIAFGMKNNYQLEALRSEDRQVRGAILTAENALLPSLTASARTATQEINLAAMGFKPASLAAFGLPAGSIHTIVKVDTTAAQLNLDQTVFNVPTYYLFRASQKAAQATNLGVLNGRGSVTLAIGSAYLKALADTAQIADAQALLKADEVAYNQAKLSHDAGVSPNIDVLRTQVQFQQQQQALISAENTFAKDKIALNRLMGLPAGQELNLTDTVPYADLAELPLADALSLAYTRRKDLLMLEAEVKATEVQRKASRYEYMPTVAVNGYYGVLGETRGLYHGVFNAQGTLKIPIFKEAQFRGEREVADAQLISLRQQIQSLHVTIEQQIRSAMLDVESTAQQVKVAQSNEALAKEELDEVTQRFKAGVDDSLPVVRAQATLADAQNRLISTTFQNNQAKLQLARNTGVVETQYRQYLNR
ncbi:Outer membrane protein TolC [Granulicella pectinivorans]|uniref:Outer membrane protein TolC n=2 Tax=Granulicella pectinivorans TaxID=474950 RepID=A0A1I6LM61_9BACT|nr:Outer membrane protein TolC [Granulicella pectinivorans]